MRARGEPGTRIAAVLVLAGAASLGACAKNREASVAPDSAPVADDIEVIDARLADNADELQRQGVALGESGNVSKRVTDETTVGDAEAEDAFDQAPAEQAMPSRDVTEESVRSKSKRERPRCERICDLAGSTCDLRARICDLSRVHEGDARYANACERATTQCDAAQAACTRCR